MHTFLRGFRILQTTKSLIGIRQEDLLMIRKTKVFTLHSTLQKTMQNKAKLMSTERATRKAGIFHRLRNCSRYGKTKKLWTLRYGFAEEMNLENSVICHRHNLSTKQIILTNSTFLREVSMDAKNTLENLSAQSANLTDSEIWS